MRTLFAILFALILACQPVAAETEVDLKLVLLVGASNSTDCIRQQFGDRTYPPKGEGIDELSRQALQADQGPIRFIAAVCVSPTEDHGTHCAR